MPGNLEQGDPREGSEKGLTVPGSWEKRLVNDSQRSGHVCWVLEDEQEFAGEEQSTESEHHVADMKARETMLCAIPSE